MAERIIASWAELGLRDERLDGSRDLDHSIALLEDQFGPCLPGTPNV